MGSLRNLIYNPLAKKNQARKLEPWHTLLIKRLGKNLRYKYPGVKFSIKTCSKSPLAIKVFWPHPIGTNEANECEWYTKNFVTDYVDIKSLRSHVLYFGSFYGGLLIVELKEQK
jgi:hypothetical protein